VIIQWRRIQAMGLPAVDNTGVGELPRRRPKCSVKVNRSARRRVGYPTTGRQSVANPTVKENR
jgi:hypothetical protein